MGSRPWFYQWDPQEEDATMLTNYQKFLRRQASEHKGGRSIPVRKGWMRHRAEDNFPTANALRAAVATRRLWHFNVDPAGKRNKVVLLARWLETTGIRSCVQMEGGPKARLANPGGSYPKASKPCPPTPIVGKDEDRETAQNIFLVRTRPRRCIMRRESRMRGKKRKHVVKKKKEKK